MKPRAGKSARRSVREKHGTMLPVSGAEVPFAPEAWHVGLVQRSHNCFSYALNMIEGQSVQKCAARLQGGQRSCRAVWPQPRTPPDMRKARHERFQCNIMHPVLMDQLKDTGFHPVARRQACPAGHYKVAFSVSAGDNYHWYRQDPDGFWSHKDGGLPVKRVDASGQPIVDPSKADRAYSNIEYSDFCGFYCVRNEQRVARDW